MTATTSRKTKGLDSSLKNLNLSPAPSRKTLPKSAKTIPPPDTWEEEADTTAFPSNPSTATASPSVSGTTTPNNADYPGPPPPTPMSPTHRRGKSTDWSAFPQSPSAVSVTSWPRATRADRGDGEKRPEKSAATANRIIAGALGQKVPKMSEEGRQYERAVREKERKRIVREKEERVKAEMEKEEAKRSVWDG